MSVCPVCYPSGCHAEDLGSLANLVEARPWVPAVTARTLSRCSTLGSLLPMQSWLLFDLPTNTALYVALVLGATWRWRWVLAVVAGAQPVPVPLPTLVRVGCLLVGGNDGRPSPTLASGIPLTRGFQLEGASMN